MINGSVNSGTTYWRTCLIVRVRKHDEGGCRSAPRPQRVQREGRGDSRREGNSSDYGDEVHSSNNNKKTEIGAGRSPSDILAEGGPGNRVTPSPQDNKKLLPCAGCAIFRLLCGGSTAAGRGVSIAYQLQAQQLKQCFPLLPPSSTSLKKQHCYPGQYESASTRFGTESRSSGGPVTPCRQMTRWRRFSSAQQTQQMRSRYLPPLSAQGHTQYVGFVTFARICDIGPSPQICRVQAIDAIITGVQPRPPVPPDIAAVVAGFEAWYKTSGIRFAPAGDTMVFSREHGYAGAADAIGYRLDGSTVVVCDFKTSNSTQQSYAFQVRMAAVIYHNYGRSST